MTQYRVWMTIRGSMVKPSYDGYADVWAENEDDARDAAVTRCQRTAHWDSPRSDFRVDRIEVR